MPRPNVLFDVFCVLNSAKEILDKAARLQAKQSYTALRSRIRLNEEYPLSRRTGDLEAEVLQQVQPALETSEVPRPHRKVPEDHETPIDAASVTTDPPSIFGSPVPPEIQTFDTTRLDVSINPLAPSFDPPRKDAKCYEPIADIDLGAPEPPVKLTASRVPSSRIGRLFHYGSLGVGMGAGAAAEMIRRSTSGSSSVNGSIFLSEANVHRLVDKLTKMRGAALKLGQFMSIQDSSVLPEQLDRILRQVQSSAHYMPNSQLEEVMASELGHDWLSNFSHFNPIPFASASIGQVHHATLAPSVAPSSLFREVAVKVQFPNVKSSIHSDIRNLSILLHGSSLLPRGLFLDKTLAVMKEELEDECDYVYEANAAREFKKHLERDRRFDVMGVVDELSTEKVLTMQRMHGVPIVRTAKLSQPKRDEIATSVLSLCLKELFHLRFMQTDPNWSNFLYNPKTHGIELIDFGASRRYSKEFMDSWYMLLQAAIDGDREGCKDHSLKIGYLTGEESPEMLDAHIQSLILLGTPFSSRVQQPFSFASSEQNVTAKIRDLIPFMLNNRLTPPPQETYSLNRKLSGAFLLCGRLGARVDCRAVWKKETAGYQIG
ncbi:ABC1 family-domain-containing protein [Cantharellus anzutake]|uniref:ABC1 family-domain-containing protein n=1 Tax=Cantharellus anzutake TaxID=1750568 RepID=UPI001904C402|nr:ABC1 family-domain-containing protein [Cantharellus anzutake]KAF8331997.1 ABC1 family-domain-containing protein [Cantharellus anzutake]